MGRMLLVFNGADYSREAVWKAVWLAKNNNSTRLDVLYINPSCNEMYPYLPGYSFWLPEKELRKLKDQWRDRVMGEMTPIFEEIGIVPEVMVRNGDIDREINELGRFGNYDNIFVASPSKYCRRITGRLKRDMREVAESLVCLV